MRLGQATDLSTWSLEQLVQYYRDHFKDLVGTVEMAPFIAAMYKAEQEGFVTLENDNRYNLIPGRDTSTWVPPDMTIYRLPQSWEEIHPPSGGPAGNVVIPSFVPPVIVRPSQETMIAPDGGYEPGVYANGNGGGIPWQYLAAGAVALLLLMRK